MRKVEGANAQDTHGGEGGDVVCVDVHVLSAQSATGTEQEQFGMCAFEASMFSPILMQ